MTGSASFLKRVNNGNLCAGCGLCEALAGKDSIEMAVSSDGYNRPVQKRPIPGEIDSSLSRTCPGLSVELATEVRANHPLWGPYLAVAEAHSTRENVRFTASSGGALTAILIHLLETKQVDFVVHNRADDANPLANITVASHTIDEIKAGAGSRYAPSSPLANLETYLATGKPFAVVGKPCDIAALRALGRLDPRIERQIPCMVSFFCAGVPSLHGARKVVEKMGASNEDVIAFRYRGHGWPGLATAELKDGSKREMSYFESWGGVLSSHVQFRCKVCPDGVGAFADIVCGDAWHCDERGYPVFEEDDGKSLVIARTESGAILLEEAQRAKSIELSPTRIDAIDAMQPGQLWRKSVVSARLLALRLLGKTVPRYSGLFLKESARYTSGKTRLKNFLGTFRRVLQQ